MAKTKIVGHCPRSCGETLYADSGGYIFCSNPDCPQPDAAHKLLDKGKQFLPFIRDDTRLLAINDSIDQPPNIST
jgi:hypothetical protein